MSIGGTVGLLSLATTTTTTTATATATAIGRADAGGQMNSQLVCCLGSWNRSLALAHYPTAAATGRKSTRIFCEVAVGSDLASPSTSSEAAVGAKVKVTAPLKVYHVPRVAEVDITGLEGEVKQYVGLWKGKRISANLPYKVQFFVDVQGRGPVKFFAHLKDDEFEFL